MPISINSISYLGVISKHINNKLFVTSVLNIFLRYFAGHTKWYNRTLTLWDFEIFSAISQISYFLCFRKSQGQAHWEFLSIKKAISEIEQIELTRQSFTFYTSVAVISSSRIEGEQMEIDSYIKHKVQEIEYLPELVEKPNDLFNAYLFARQNKLTQQNFLQSHILLSGHLLTEKRRGVYRKNEMLVMEHKTGRIQFEAAPYDIVENEMNKLWEDIEELLHQTLNEKEIFYYASFIHLVFVTIHPFNDGNGRAGRMLEKWFLAQLLGEKAWYIKSEKYYYHHLNEYYKNLNRLGMFYEKINYSNADRFLQMLPNAINYKE